MVFFSPVVFAEPFVHIDKSSYVYGDMIKISGIVEYEEGIPIIIQLRSPSDIVVIDQLFPSRSGSFVASFVAEGPKWSASGRYTILVSYQERVVEKNFQFLKTNPESHQSEIIKQEVATQKPKITIKNFPDPTKSPQYYFDQYKNNQDFKRWFDTTFVGYTIYEIVGYKPTTIVGFPDPQHSPQYYIDRYNNEERFKQWFDAQFPQKTIYDIVGITEKVRTIVPSWVKQYAKLWSNGEIDDRRFIEGVDSLIRLDIIIIDAQMLKQDNDEKIIPSWVKIAASWYGQDMITEEEFLRGIQYLVEKGFILV